MQTEKNMTQINIVIISTSQFEKKNIQPQKLQASTTWPWVENISPQNNTLYNNIISYMFSILQKCSKKLGK